MAVLLSLMLLCSAAVALAGEITDPEELFSRGKACYEGEGVEENDEEAMEYFLLAAQQNHARAMDYIGMMYLYGEGVEQDAAEAARWYRKGAEANCEDAQEKLGALYQEGIGVEKNSELAQKWLAVAAKEDYDTALAMVQEILAAE